MQNSSIGSKKARIITLEEHFVTPAFLNSPESKKTLRADPSSSQPQVAAMAKIMESAAELGEKRIAEMDAAGIDVQVLSLHSPGVEQLDASEAVRVAHETNMYLANALKQYPDRLAGFAVVPTAAPNEAADELSRMVGDFGFKGAVINGHTQERYLDDEFFWPILERAQALHVPIYLHPTTPPKAVVQAYYTGNFAPGVTQLFATPAWGWHIETAVHVLRIILGGAFDRFPDLQIIIGHMGEALPFMLPRLDTILTPGLTKLNRKVGDYLRENISYTFSSYNCSQAFLDLFLQVGSERIMFSVDYPYFSMSESRAFLERLPISPADKERIAHGNAEKLLRL